MGGKTIVFLFLASFIPSIPTVRSQTNVWPKPRAISWPTPQAIHLSHCFTIQSPAHPNLRHAVRHYLRLIHAEHHLPIRPVAVNLTRSPPLDSLLIAISDLSAPLQHGVSESYNLTIPKPGAGSAAELRAETAWGAMRGLETFSQLVWVGREDGRLRVAVGLQVRDGPLFPHRGVLLDTSRNFYRVKDLKRLIRAMAMNKMNVFHWHVTDSQSFPLVVESEAELGKKGSYGEEMQYDETDVRRVVEYGMRHGVRVMPEIDTPGHAASWAEAYPEIVTCAGRFWLPAGEEPLAAEPAPGQLNPLHPKTYQVLQNLIRDVAPLFPEHFYHAGADEINPACWKAEPQIQEFLSNGGTLSQLLEMFINSTHPFIASFNRTVVYWEDVLLDPIVKVASAFLPPENTILQSWKNGPEGTKLIVAAGYRAIVSSTDFYYLDCGHGGFLGNDSRYDREEGADGSWCSPFKTWQQIYDYDICHGLSEREAKLVLGGEVALWSEQADPTVMDSRIWPRASAMAEALWSGNREGTAEGGGGGKKRYAEATDRLSEWRYRMVGRGIGAEPIQPLWCLHHPRMCDLE